MGPYCLSKRLRFWDLPGDPMVKNPSASAGDMDSIPGLEDTLEKEMATYSSILAWEIPGTKVPGRLQSMGLQRVRHNLATEQQQAMSKTMCL